MKNSPPRPPTPQFISDTNGDIQAFVFLPSLILDSSSVSRISLSLELRICIKYSHAHKIASKLSISAHVYNYVSACEHVNGS